MQIAAASGLNVSTLVLNADMQPVSWAPLSVWSWQEAITAVMQGRVLQLRSYDDIIIRSPSTTFQVPSIVALKDYHKRKRVVFNRYNVFLRDRFRCQYCGEAYHTKDLTFDHVVPKSRGGQSRWDNIVASCAADNLRKANRTPAEAGMKLLREPCEPSPFEIDKVARSHRRKDDLHVTWLDFLYWDGKIEA